MTGREFIGSNVQPGLTKKPSFGPYPEFIFCDVQGRILGEYVPMPKGSHWSGGDKDTILGKKVLSWYITWDQQDIDVVQFWITVDEKLPKQN